MRGAVDFGTARRAGYDSTEPILGKTGTCTDFQTASHMGWFGSFNEVGAHRLVVVVMLTGGRNVSGPIAAGVAGAIYRNLSAQRYFVADAAPEEEIRPARDYYDHALLRYGPLTASYVRAYKNQGDTRLT